MTTASEDAGLTKSSETDTDKAVREAEESLAAAKAVKADEERTANPTTTADTAGNGDTSTTSDPVADSTATTDEPINDEVPQFPTVSELGEASTTLRAQNQTKVAAFLDQVGEQVAQGLPDPEAPQPPDPTKS